MALYEVVGLPVKIELPVPLAHRILPKSQTRQRPGIKRQLPGYFVCHETDNHAPGADAEMHARYLNNGAGGRTASWHFTVDDGIIYQHIPIDEVTWQAADGNGPGNMSGISCELCVNAGIDTAKARHNAEALCAGIIGALHMSVDKVKAHIDFNAGTANRHHCPDTMLNDGYWPNIFKSNVSNILSSSTVPDPVPPVLTPQVPAWFAHGLRTGTDQHADGETFQYLERKLTAIRRVQKRTFASKHAPLAGSLDIADKITSAFVFNVEEDGRSTAWVLDRDGWAYTLSGLTPRISVPLKARTV